MDAEQAMQEYISCVNVLDPEGSTKVRSHISLLLKFHYVTVQKHHMSFGKITKDIINFAHVYS